MSPEQATGQRELDARSDVYSLAFVVYEMLAGIPPFVGPTPESVLAQKVTQPPRSLRVFRPAITKAVDSAIARALMLTPADRFKDPLEFADALERASHVTGDDASDAARVRARRWAYASLGVAGVVAAIVVYGKLTAATATNALADRDPRRLAVLYFDDLTPDKRLGHIASGLTENLIDQLSEVRHLRVISPNGVRRFRNTDLPLDSMAKDLDAGTLISGSVSRAGAQLRVSVRMIDAANGAQINSRTLERPFWDFFRLQDTLTADVAYWLRERLGAQVRIREHRAGTLSVPAWEMTHTAEQLTREGTELVAKGDSTAARVFRRADSLLAAAEAVDPKWLEPIVVRARVAMSSAFVHTDGLGRPTPRFADQLGVAIAHADRALRRNGDLADALTVRAQARARLVAWFGAQPAESLITQTETDLRRAVTLRPDRALSWYALGDIAFQQAKFSDAADALRTAIDMDPFLEHIRSAVVLLFMSSLYDGKFDEARRWCRHGTSRFAGDPRFGECELNVLVASGRTASDAAAAWRMIRDIERSDSLRVYDGTWSYRRTMVAGILARAGLRDSARAVLGRIHRERLDRPSADTEEAHVRILLDERDTAIGLLTKVLGESPNERTWIGRLPWFEALHSDPRFRDLVASR